MKESVKQRLKILIGVTFGVGGLLFGASFVNEGDYIGLGICMAILFTGLVIISFALD